METKKISKKHARLVFEIEIEDGTTEEEILDRMEDILRDFISSPWCIDDIELTEEILDDSVKHPKERTWNTWILSEFDIQEVAEQNELSLEGRDLDEIARLYEKGISAMLGDCAPDWTDILKEAIQNTEPEAQEGK